MAYEIMMSYDFTKIDIWVTILMIFMVVLMPMIDQRLNRKLGVALDDSLSSNQDADKYLHARKLVLYCVFGLYIMAVLFVTFFSRSAASDYQIHIAFYQDLANAVKIDFGILGFIHSIFTDGLAEALQHVSVEKMDSISQVYLNVVMFIPMGYLLPYVFDKFQKAKGRTVLNCFLFSLLIENVQLITKHGFYDIDDIVSNTLGGFLGFELYMLFAYFLRHPRFREEMEETRQYRLQAKDKPMFPYFRKMHTSRVVLYACNAEEVLNFFTSLGFRMKKEIEDGPEHDYLLSYGNNEIEVRCNRKYTDFPDQEITLALNNNEFLKEDLEEKGFDTGSYRSDPYTGLRTYRIMGPDHIIITLIEE